MISLTFRCFPPYKSQSDYELAINRPKLNQKVKLDLKANFEIL